MQILSIHLKNIKSHRDTELVFSPGINVLSGPNGAGKSTVFEAVGYALFGVEARDFVSNVERFLTIGTKRGEISVVFRAAAGDTYRVTRTVGTPSTWRLAKEVGGAFEVEDHAGYEETEERIRELLGLAKGRSLADQFKLVIGPFQSEFLGPFVLKQPTKRKEAFDEILGINSWRKTFDGTKELGNTIKAKLENLATEIAGKEERTAFLPERQEEFKLLALEEEKKGAELSEVSAAIAASTDLLRGFEERKTEIGRLRGEILQVRQKIDSGNEHVTSQKVLVEQAEEAARTVEQARPGKERFEAVERTLLELREKEKRKQALEKELADLSLTAAKARQAAEHEEREAVAQETKLREERAAVEADELRQRQELATLVEEEARRQGTFDLVKEIDRDFRLLPLARVEKDTPYLRLTLARLAEIDGAVAEKKGLLNGEEEAKRVAEGLEPLRLEREKLLAERARLLGRMAGLSEGEEKLKEGVCPFFGEQCGNMSDPNFIGVFPERKNRIRSEVETIETAVSALEGSIAISEAAEKEMVKFRLLRSEIGVLQRERDAKEKERASYLRRLDPDGIVRTFTTWAVTARLDGCPGGDLTVDVSGEPSMQLSNLIEWEQTCRMAASSAGTAIGVRLIEAEGPLTEVRNRRTKAEAELSELRRRLLNLSEGEKLVEERRKAAAALRAVMEQTDRDRGVKLRLIAGFQDVEPALREAEEQRRLSQPDHERYLRAEPVAKELPRRRETLEKYRKRLADLEEELLAAIRSLALLEEGYSPERHAEEQKKKEALQAAAATLKESLKNLSRNRQRLQQEILELEKIREEIRRKQEESRVLRKKEELVKFLRNKVFKNVSAQLSERFREEITLRADRIYRTISEADEELIWGEDYRIVLRDMTAGEIRERTDDQLSGGQTMSAVVALRLALLQTIGARIAFFDEPTSNLDVSRRENLARAFRAIDVGREEVTEHWYDQLFLISHDVAFTEITDQTVQLGE
jgi:exonuclease SbcC